MISCTEFIPAYSELFGKLETIGGKEAVLKFWEYISDNYLGELRELSREKGQEGCWEYWARALNEEAADFTMKFDPEKGVFSIEMHKCPSKGLLLKLNHIEPYQDYCEHCNVLYGRVLAPLGLKCVLDDSRCDKGTCKFTITQKTQ